MRIYNELLKRKIATWIDSRNLSPGDDIMMGIQNAIKNRCNVLLIIISSDTFASHYCLKECELAISNGMAIIPLMFEQCKTPDMIKQYLFIDFSNPKNFDFAINTLLKGLEKQSKIEYALMDLNNSCPATRIDALKYLSRFLLPRVFYYIKKNINNENDEDVLYWYVYTIGKFMAIKNQESQEALEILTTLKEKTNSQRILQGIDDVFGDLNI